MFQEARKDGEWAKINCDRNLLKRKPESTLFVTAFRCSIIIRAKAERKFSSKMVAHDRVIMC